MPNSACSKTKEATPGFFGFLSDWTGKGLFYRGREKGEMRLKAFLKKRGRGTTAEKFHTGIGRAKQVRPSRRAKLTGPRRRACALSHFPRTTSAVDVPLAPQRRFRPAAFPRVASQPGSVPPPRVSGSGRVRDRVMTQAKCKGDHNRTPHNAFQAVVTVYKFN